MGNSTPVYVYVKSAWNSLLLIPCLKGRDEFWISLVNLPGNNLTAKQWTIILRCGFSIVISIKKQCASTYCHTAQRVLSTGFSGRMWEECLATKWILQVSDPNLIYPLSQDDTSGKGSYGSIWLAKSLRPRYIILRCLWSDGPLISSVLRFLLLFPRQNNPTTQCVIVRTGAF